MRKDIGKSTGVLPYHTLRTKTCYGILGQPLLNLESRGRPRGTGGRQSAHYVQNPFKSFLAPSPRAYSPTTINMDCATPRKLGDHEMDRTAPRKIPALGSGGAMHKYDSRNERWDPAPATHTRASTPTARHTQEPDAGVTTQQQQQQQHTRTDVADGTAVPQPSEYISRPDRRISRPIAA